MTTPEPSVSAGTATNPVTEQEQRVEYAKLATAVPEEHMPVWAEWMPFQMAQSQAPASTKLAERIAGLEEGMLALMNQTTSRANQLADDLEGVKKTQTSGLLESANAAAATPGRRLDAIEARLNEVHEYLTKYTPFVGKDQQPMPADPCRKD